MRFFCRSKNPWPIGLILFFIIFASYIVGFVIFASRQKMDLVREDYYDQEIRFQQQIDRVQRTTPMLASGGIDYNRTNGFVTVSLPPHNSGAVSGAVTFYRPSDASMDNNVQLGLDSDGRQSISVSSLRTGFWKVRVQWKNAGQEYFFEKPIVIQQKTS